MRKKHVAIGGADRTITIECESCGLLDAGQVAIVGEHMHAARDLAREGLCVGKGYGAACRAPNVRDHKPRGGRARLEKADERTVTRCGGLAKSATSLSS